MEENNTYRIHKLWATRITGMVLAIGGIIGVGHGIMYSGWLIFIAFCVLMNNID